MKLQNFVQMQISDKDGNATPAFTRMLGDFTGQLQGALSDEGYILPYLSSAQIAQLDPSKSANALFIKSDTQQLIVNLNGAFVAVQTAPI